MPVHTSLLYSRFVAAFAQGTTSGSAEKLFNAGELGMIRSLFDDIEEKPQAKIETINEPEVQAEPKDLPEEEIFQSLPDEEEISLEIPDFNDGAMAIEMPHLNYAATTIETPDLNERTATSETFDFDEAAKTTDNYDLNEAAGTVENYNLSNETPSIETPIWHPIEITSEIMPPTDISILHDAEKIEEPVEQPEITVSHTTKTIDELRMQSNTANTRDQLTITEAINEPVRVRAKPESLAETARKSGLAMSAAITLFGSVVFLLIIGWFADLLLGTSPWGKVGGIILGSLIGFFQFFRMTSQILKDKD